MSLRLLIAWGFCFGLAAGVSRGESPQWIWATAGANETAPVGSCHFRKSFRIQNPTSGIIEITADNRYELRLNGRLVGASDRWQQVDRYDVTELLVDRENVVDVRCVNDGDAAGLAARLVVQAAGGEKQQYVTGPDWQAFLQTGRSWNPAEFDNRKASKTFVLGRLGEAKPWGRVPVSDQIHKVAAARQWNGRPFQLVDGDRVVLLGNTLIERAQQYGYWETALTTRFPRAYVRFRNLGWSGDTVFGHARARFGDVAEGFAHLERSVSAARPTVVLVGYGSNAATAGQEGLSAFSQGLERLLGTLEATGAKLALLSPLRQESLPPPLPDPQAQNRRLQLYVDTIYEVAKQRGYKFVNFFEQLAAAAQQEGTERSLTDNGIHLTAYGYWRAALAMEQQLGLPPRVWQVRVSLNDGSVATQGTELVGESLKKSDRGKAIATWTLQDAYLPLPPPEGCPGDPRSQRRLHLVGLTSGEYRLTVDGAAVARASADQWAQGVVLSDGPEVQQAEKLRAAIRRKNELYFHRWRPQNETYLYLFRKHEQGNNAREIPQFDPLIAAAEQQIARLRAPQQHEYRIERVQR